MEKVKKYDEKLDMFYEEWMCPVCGCQNWQYLTNEWHLEDHFCDCEYISQFEDGDRT